MTTDLILTNTDLTIAIVILTLGAVTALLVYAKHVDRQEAKAVPDNYDSEGA